MLPVEGFSASWTDLPSFESVFPTDWEIINMEEGQVAEKPKRQRAKKESTALKGNGIACAGQMIVCTYCGGTDNKALVPTTLIKGVAFDTFPCGLAWISANAKDPLTAAALHEGFSKLYGQPPGGVVQAPPTDPLFQFGGNLTIEQWLPSAELWRQVTQRDGIGFKDLPTTKSRSKKTAGASAVVTLEVAAYLIPVKGAPKKVEAIDGVAKKTGEITIVEAQRKLRKFANANKQYGIHHFDEDKFSVSACVAEAEADAAQLNNTATQLVGSNVYGPALAVVCRKTSVKV